MDLDFKSEERDLFRLVTYFKKRAEILIIENRLGDEYKQLLDACDTLSTQLQSHMQQRIQVHAEHQQLLEMVNDNAKCPKCQRLDLIKKIGVDTSPQGWKSNRYKCRRCNITFAWSAPNNPWDMIPYVEQFVEQMEEKSSGLVSAEEQSAHQQALDNMRDNLAKLRPVISASDLKMKELAVRELQMAELVHKFKKQLMIEKIRLED